MTAAEPASNMSDSEPVTGMASGRWTAIAVGLAIVALTVLHLGIDYLVDDAYITFRYSRNWVEWGTPVFNAFELAAEGQPVEGYSNFLWMAWLALLHAVGVDLPSAASWSQLALAALTIVAVGKAVSTRGGLRLGHVGAASAPLLLATSAPFVAWSSGGMEVTAFTLFLTLTLLCGLGSFRNDAAAKGTWRGALPVGLAAAATALTRVDGILWVTGVAIAVATAGTWGGSGSAARKRALGAVGFALVAVLLQVAWRRSVYGEWLPNTVTAKSGGGGDAAVRGAKQLAAWALVTITPVFAVLAVIPACRHRVPAARAAAAAAFVSMVGFALYQVALGGDWMPFFRFLVPLAPALALLVAIGVDALPSKVGAAVAAIAIVLQVTPLYDVHVAPESLRESLRFRAFQGGYKTEWQRVDVARANEAMFGKLGQALDHGTEDGDVLVFGAIGSTGWYAKDLDFLDRNGLVTPAVAEREVTKKNVTAGHEKRVAHAWFLDHGDRVAPYLYATYVDSIIRGPADRGFPALKQFLRKGGVLSRPPEREMFARTIPKLVAIEEGPAAGGTLVLMQRVEPAVAAQFWGSR